MLLLVALMVTQAQHKRSTASDETSDDERSATEKTLAAQSSAIAVCGSG